MASTSHIANIPAHLQPRLDGKEGDSMGETIPPQAMQYLKHLPTIAKWIQTNKRISGLEMAVFKIAYAEPYRMLKGATYEQMAKIIRPYKDDAQYGHYVQLALSPQGEQWLRYALDLIHRS